MIKSYIYNYVKKVKCYKYVLQGSSISACTQYVKFGHQPSYKDTFINFRIMVYRV